MTVSGHLSNTPKYVSSLFITFLVLGHVVDNIEQVGDTLGTSGGHIRRSKCNVYNLVISSKFQLMVSS